MYMKINHSETLRGSWDVSTRAHRDVYERFSTKRACLRDTLRIGNGPAPIPKNLIQERNTRESILDTVF